MYFYLLMNKDFIIIINYQKCWFLAFWLAVCIIRNAITAKFDGIFWVASPLNPMFFSFDSPIKTIFFLTGSPEIPPAPLPDKKRTTPTVVC